MSSDEVLERGDDRPTSGAYAGVEPGLLEANYDLYQMKPATSERPWRSKSTIVLSNTKGGIDRDGETDIVDVIHISRSSVSFRSALDYDEGAAVSIATHYIRGGQNIYQAGVIVNVRRRPSDDEHGEYEIQFAPLGPPVNLPPQELFLRNW